MEKHVDFEKDLGFMLTVIKGEYEKANIWGPYNNRAEAEEILDEEVQEAEKELKTIVNTMQENRLEDIRTRLADIRGHALRGVCENIQIVAVCNKYEQMLDREGK